MLNANKTCATISRGAGSNETTMGLTTRRDLLAPPAGAAAILHFMPSPSPNVLLALMVARP